LFPKGSGGKVEGVLIERIVGVEISEGFQRLVKVDVAVIFSATFSARLL
jgi:hypothetical protein